MKNPVLSLLVAGSLLIAPSCKKSDPTPTQTQTPTSTIPTDGWTLNSTKYKQVVVVRQESQGLVNAVDGTSGKINSFGAFFKSYPTANGTYKIVGFTPDSTSPYPNQKIADGEVVLIATVSQASGSNKSYWTTGTENKSATVTVANGKIKVEVPEVSVTSTSNDNQKLTGTIDEK